MMMKKENYSHRGTNTRKMKQRIDGEQLIPHKSSRMRVCETLAAYLYTRPALQCDDVMV